MPLAPFAPHPDPEKASRRGRLAVLLAVLGIAAVLLAYAISPSVRHAVKRAAHSVGHAVTHVFKGNERPAAPALPDAVVVAPRVTLHTLRGHPALIAFWAAHCQACSREAPALEQLARSPAGRGRVVGVSYADSPRAAHAFVVRHHWTFPNLLDASGAVGRRYGIKSVRGLPAAYALDSTGHIAAVLKGPLTGARLSGGLKKAASEQ